LHIYLTFPIWLPGFAARAILIEVYHQDGENGSFALTKRRDFELMGLPHIPLQGE